MKDRKTKPLLTRPAAIALASIILLFLFSITFFELVLVLFTLLGGWALFIISNAHYVVTHYPIAIVLLVAVVAVYLILDIALSKFWNINNERKWQQRWTRGIVVAAIIFPIVGTAASNAVLQLTWLLAVDPPGIVNQYGGRSREAANRIKCASNLREIGQAALQYAEINGGALPDSMELLFQNGTLENRLLECESSGFVAPSENESPAVRDAFIRQGRAAYVYYGRGLKLPLPADYPLLSEPTMHHIHGANICFGDGRVEFMRLDEVQKYLDRVNRNPATQPAE